LPDVLFQFSSVSSGIWHMTSAHKGYALLPFLSYKETVKLKAYPIVKFNFLKAISSVMEYKTPWMAHIFCKYAWHCVYITE